MNKKLGYILIILVAGLFIISIYAQDALGRRVRTSYTSCEDTDGGYNYEITGNITLRRDNGEEREFTDYCRNENNLLEYGCTERYGGFIAGNRVIDCSEEFEEGFCSEGRCYEGNRWVTLFISVLPAEFGEFDFWHKESPDEREVHMHGNRLRPIFPINASGYTTLKTGTLGLQIIGNHRFIEWGGDIRDIENFNARDVNEAMIPMNRDRNIVAILR